MLCVKLASLLDFDGDGRVGVADWVMGAERVTRGSIREHLKMFRWFVKPDVLMVEGPSMGTVVEDTVGMTLARTNSTGLRAIVALETNAIPSDDEMDFIPVGKQVQELLRPLMHLYGSRETEKFDEAVRDVVISCGQGAQMFTVGSTRLFDAFTKVLLSLFVPMVQDMVRKLKNPAPMTVHTLSFCQGGTELDAVRILCEAMTKAHARDPKSHDFNLSSFRDQKAMVEAVSYGVRYSDNTDEWSVLGVPLLLLAVRVYMRNFLEALFTQDISIFLMVRVVHGDDSARISLLRNALNWLPMAHRATLTTIMNCVTQISTSAEWLNNVTICLVCVVFNPKACSNSSTPVAERIFRLLFLHWKTISGVPGSPRREDPTRSVGPARELQSMLMSN